MFHRHPRISVVLVLAVLFLSCGEMDRYLDLNNGPVGSIWTVHAFPTLASLPFVGTTQVNAVGTPQIAELQCVAAAGTGRPGTLTEALKNTTGTVGNTGNLLAAVYTLTAASIPGSGNCTPNKLVATSGTLPISSLTSTFNNYTFTFTSWSTTLGTITAGQNIAVGILATSGNFTLSRSPTADTHQEVDSCSFNVVTFGSVNCGVAVICGVNACPSYTLIAGAPPGDQPGGYAAITSDPRVDILIGSVLAVAILAAMLFFIVRPRRK